MKHNKCPHCGSDEILVAMVKPVATNFKDIISKKEVINMNNTETKYIDEFYDNFSKYKDTEFKTAGWYEKHVTENAIT
jgi:hypothetical protein